jgi:hypothetical protein
MRSRKTSKQTLVDNTLKLLSSKSSASKNWLKQKVGTVLHTSKASRIEQSEGVAAERISDNNASPMQRYLSTPPKDDPAPLAAIKHAAAASAWNDYRQGAKRGSKRSQSESDETDAQHDQYRVSGSDRGYDSVSMSGFSNSSSFGSHGSNASHASWSGRKGRKRHRTAPNLSSDAEDSMHFHKYQYTWCFQSFKRAWEWQRHEESQHAPQKEYVCLYDVPLGYGVCVFCDVENPDDAHYKIEHQADRCFSRPLRDRAFDRKDHLRQHIRQIHKPRKALKDIETWSREIPNSTQLGGWLCGFCHEAIPTWADRLLHVRNHFDTGSNMQDWSLRAEDVSLRRESRSSLPKRNVYGCPNCHRCFLQPDQLSCHRQIPVELGLA